MDRETIQVLKAIKVYHPFRSHALFGTVRLSFNLSRVLSEWGEVLIEINSRKVESKAQAVSLVKADYNRGVRTFTTKWWANGQVVDRTYQAPDK